MIICADSGDPVAWLLHQLGMWVQWLRGAAARQEQLGAPHQRRHACGHDCDNLVWSQVLAVGAAISVLITLVAHNILKQLGLGFGAGILHRAQCSPYGDIAGRGGHRPLVRNSILVAAAARRWTGSSWLLIWLLLLRVTRASLRLVVVFPEAARVSRSADGVSTSGDYRGPLDEPEMVDAAGP